MLTWNVGSFRKDDSAVYQPTASSISLKLQINPIRGLMDSFILGS